MRNYMMHIVLHDGHNPRFYKPKEDHVILGDHVAHFFGCQHARMVSNHPSIEDAWSIRDSTYHVGPCADSMPRKILGTIWLPQGKTWVASAGVPWGGLPVVPPVPCTVQALGDE